MQWGNKKIYKRTLYNRKGEGDSDKRHQVQRKNDGKKELLRREKGSSKVPRGAKTLKVLATTLHICPQKCKNIPTHLLAHLVCT